MTIAFHEGEDRLVKQTIREWKKKKESSRKHPLEPSTDELMANPKVEAQNYAYLRRWCGDRKNSTLYFKFVCCHILNHYFFARTVHCMGETCTSS